MTGMGNGFSEDRSCEKCGYVFAPFETTCPKCAIVAATPPAARSDSPTPGSRGPTRVQPKAIASIGALAIGLLAILVVATLEVANPAHRGSTSLSGRTWQLMTPILILIGYALGTRKIWQGCSFWLARTLVAFLVLGFLASVLAGPSSRSSPALDLVMPPAIIGASALLSRLIDRSLGWEVCRVVGLVLVLAMVVTIFAYVIAPDPSAFAGWCKTDFSFLLRVMIGLLIVLLLAWKVVAWLFWGKRFLDH